MYHHLQTSATRTIHRCSTGKTIMGTRSPCWTRSKMRTSLAAVSINITNEASKDLNEAAHSDGLPIATHAPRLATLLIRREARYRQVASDSQYAIRIALSPPTVKFTKHNTEPAKIFAHTIRLHNNVYNKFNVQSIAHDNI